MPKERNKADGYREKAYEGDTKAKNNLGVCYERGTGVKVCLELAFEWYMKAAELGEQHFFYNNLLNIRQFFYAIFYAVFYATFSIFFYAIGVNFNLFLGEIRMARNVYQEVRPLFVSLDSRSGRAVGESTHATVDGIRIPSRLICRPQGS